ncbi:serine hydroxymethyltransferase [Rhodococcus sp. PAMC28707]|uniref:serine hydroxymethyltransferase n=1 Tax=unclassified Rhodococcus (in: high G+C Gram-positive bacteria) TaxID=192944 RepID=UPI00109E1226|nr:MULTISPECIES: serine hydroxymethyltransferase [unclassified Rhodococcus (in: high G+C Gram-positive bacteria)]QCB52102.1 serine hydroxymethyltransferase [Rhodococcus sp. PAMC28705]QCB59730.1 serine hydroxymethyltransferase [Rhodococcus sp. PAMC28707]
MSETPFYGPDFAELHAEDPEIADVLLGELERVRGGLQLIASENLTSPAVMAAQGSILTNKYAEGYPGHRYYGGCEMVDRAENLAVDRAKALFGADHVNVQPHSGASANLAVYAAFAKPGDAVLAMSLPHGGHLTHGSKVSFSGKWFSPVPYHVRKDTELIDYDEVRDLALVHRPKIIVAGATAYSRLIDFATFRSIADEVGAVLWVDAAHFIGLVAGQAIPSPVPYADVVSATTHKVLRGPRGGMLMCRAEHARAIDKAVFPFSQGGPLMHTVAAKAVAFAEAATPSYRKYALNVVANAQALSTSLVESGMRTVSGGTDTHLALLDLQGFGIDGRSAESRCEAAGITLNKNTIPFDPAPPAVASGIRVGSAAVTTQGFDTSEMAVVGKLVARAVRAEQGTVVGDREIAAVKAEVGDLVSRKPAYSRA